MTSVYCWKPLNLESPRCSTVIVETDQEMWIHLLKASVAAPAGGADLNTCVRHGRQFWRLSVFNSSRLKELFSHLQPFFFSGLQRGLSRDVHIRWSDISAGLILLCYTAIAFGDRLSQSNLQWVRRLVVPTVMQILLNLSIIRRY